MADVQHSERLRTYERGQSVVFWKTKEAFGGLSNMAGGFTLRVNGVRILTSEALYQACRFPHLPQVQQLIIGEASPMTAKMAGKPYRADSRPDWDACRVRIMRWCLRVKLMQHFQAFSRLLLETRGRPIVEHSRKDEFWGAKPTQPERLVGENVLGRLLMELRAEVEQGLWPKGELQPPDLPNFLLYEQPIEPVRAADALAPVRSLTPVAAAPVRPRPVAHDHSKDRMTQPAARKKLIEVSIPLEAINKASAREKSIRHGHPSTLHLWWARRPLAACRAVLFAQLVDDPSSWPDRFPNPAAVERERARLHKVIERIVPWEASNDEAILQEARHEIARSVAWGLGEEPPDAGDQAGTLRYLQEKAPPVYDPFSGGGSIPVEAQRLGLRAHGSDLNPVAVLIGKALVEIPPRFAGLPPVNPSARASLPAGGWRRAAGLAADVRHYGAWVREEAARRIGHLYPKAQLPGGGKAAVIAWLWARTVRSPDPAARGAMVPLVSSFLLSTKEGQKSWVNVVPDTAAQDGWRFEAQTGVSEIVDQEQLKRGTKSAKGGAFVCSVTGSAIEREYVQTEGKADRLGQRLMAVVAEGTRSRIYLSPDSVHEAAIADAESLPIIAEARTTYLLSSTPTRAMITGGVCSAYGLRTWGHLFTPRQIVALDTFADLIVEVREQVLADARRAMPLHDHNPLHAAGGGAIAYADAVSTYLGLALGRSSDFWSSLATWQSAAKNELVAHTFVRQALPMTWDFAEANPFSSSGGNFTGNLAFVVKALEAQQASGVGTVLVADAVTNDVSDKPGVFCTDPPYYDNISYADLSDYFYVWLRRALCHVWPDLFRRLVTSKDAELVATPYRHGSKEKADAFFMGNMGAALVTMHHAVVDNIPIVIYYAFKQSEAAIDGTASPGWASFLQAIIDSGLGVDGTWPIRTERAARSVALGTNALASSIVLVCRKRPDNAPVTTRAEFVRILRRELPDAVAAIRRAGVGPVDMQQSVIGPGMGVFTRHAQVLEDDDSPMPVRTALSLINRVWDEIENEAMELLDPPSQVALAWFAAYGFDVRPAGDLITLANAKNLPAAALFAAGVFHDGRGKAALMPRDQLPPDWTPADGKANAWGCVQHAIRTLNAPDGGAEATAALLAAMGPMAEPARTLADRLFRIATEKGWAAEALAYNALAEEWPRLLDLASQPGDASAAVQAELFSA